MTDIGNILFHLLEKFVRKQLTIVINSTPVILSIENPHHYQNVHSPMLLKAISIYCGTIRGMAYKSLLTIFLFKSVKFDVNVVIYILTQTCFKLYNLPPDTFLDFNSGVYYIP